MCLSAIQGASPGPVQQKALIRFFGTWDNNERCGP